ncbi:hypothetical protein [Methylomonas sp. DH-1]|uniref:hypothetical protein n=1 Tax=Methylomonas sp. (strain DH-1) TaxID=1727196 RepID=UPI0007C95A3A|nr:hypothetical protein [Methylomonas sp. DH-1]ANE57474.1 hypothetical protein AYM39_21330 [Methylomonas sp. DH-1]
MRYRDPARVKRNKIIFWTVCIFLVAAALDDKDETKEKQKPPTVPLRVPLKKIYQPLRWLNPMEIEYAAAMHAFKMLEQDSLKKDAERRAKLKRKQQPATEATPEDTEAEDTEVKEHWIRIIRNGRECWYNEDTKKGKCKPA